MGEATAREKGRKGEREKVRKGERGDVLYLELEHVLEALHLLGELQVDQLHLAQLALHIRQHHHLLVLQRRTKKGRVREVS